MDLERVVLLRVREEFVVVFRLTGGLFKISEKLGVLMSFRVPHLADEGDLLGVHESIADEDPRFAAHGPSDRVLRHVDGAAQLVVQHRHDGRHRLLHLLHLQKHEVNRFSKWSGGGAGRGRDKSGVHTSGRVVPAPSPLLASMPSVVTAGGGWASEKVWKASAMLTS